MEWLALALAWSWEHVWQILTVIALLRAQSAAEDVRRALAQNQRLLQLMAQAQTDINVINDVTGAKEQFAERWR